MSSPVNIDLSSFPFVARQAILYNFDIASLFLFSLCSEKAHKVVKYLRHYFKPTDFGVHITVGSFKFKIDFATNEQIVIMKQYDSVVVESNFCEDGIIQRREKVIMNVTDLKNVWTTNNNCLDAFDLLNYLHDLFDIKRPWFWIYDDECIQEDTKLDVKEIVKNAPPTMNFFCDFYNLSDENYSYVLQNVKTNCLEMFQSSDGFNELNLDMSRSNIKYFRSNQARWVTLRHLMDWDFVEMSLEDVSMESFEMNSLLMSWTSGQKTNMRHLKIGVVNDSLFFTYLVLSGLPVVRTRDKKLFHRENSFHKQKEVSIEGGDEIRGINGAVCRVFISPWEIECYFWSSD